MSTPFVERRNHARRRVFKGGRLAFNSGTVDCTVRNISEGGANIDVSNPAALPDQLTLLIDSDHLKRRCHKVWSHDNRIGLAFE